MASAQSSSVGSTLMGPMRGRSSSTLKGVVTYLHQVFKQSAGQSMILMPSFLPAAPNFNVSEEKNRTITSTEAINILLRETCRAADDQKPRSKYPRYKRLPSSKYSSAPAV
uniref:Uncharacterized protein n=1 Tax=Timema poppense TaxID=170557 RepID=A0A7R9CVD3_TIMPO|nr:unnamed protein product [Timema poppensis]